MKCNCSHQDSVSLGIGSNLIFIPIFVIMQYSFQRYLFNNFVFNSTVIFNSCLQSTSLDKKRFGWIILRYRIDSTIWTKHRIARKYSFYNFCVSWLVAIQFWIININLIKRNITKKWIKNFFADLMEFSADWIRSRSAFICLSWAMCMIVIKLI